MQSATHWWPLIAAAVGIAALYLPAVLAPAAGTFHDDGIYLVTAKAIAGGDGYRILSLPTEVVQTKYPFLFPASLAAVWKLMPEFPSNLPVLRLLTLFWAVLWCRFAYLVIKREKGAVTASVIVVLTLCSPWVLFIATSPLSETLFAALTWAALFEFGKYEEQAEEPDGRQRLRLAALLSGAAAVTRVVGVTLIGAAVLLLLARRRIRSAVSFAAVSTATVLPWLAWTAFAGSGAGGYNSASNYASWNLITNYPWSEKLTVLGHNLLLFFLTPGYLFGLFSQGTIPLMLVLGGLTLVGLIARVRGGITLIDLFLLLYIVALAVWPWPPIRFMAPLYPLIVLAMWQGVERLSRLLGGRGHRALVFQRATAGLAVFLAPTILASTSMSTMGSGTVVPAPACQDDWGEFEGVIDWVEANTPPDAVLASNLDPLLFLYTGRKAVRPFEANPIELYYTRSTDGEALGPPAELARRLVAAGVDYVITTPGTCFREKPHLERQLAALAADRSGGLEEVVRFSSSTRVFAVNRERLAR